ALRPVAPGHPQAGAGRLPGRRGDPGARATGGGPPARHRLDGAVAEGGPRAVLAGGHGRVPRQAVHRCRTVGGHRPGPEITSPPPTPPPRPPPPPRASR